MLNQFAQYISRIPSELFYRIELIRHASKLPVLSAQDQSIVDAVRREGVFVTSLEDLGLTKTPTLIEAAQNELIKMEVVKRSALFFVYTAKNPLRPECCKQYSDQTFPRLLPTQQNSGVGAG